MLGDKKQYKQSHYYREFQLPYEKHIVDSPEYRLYNAVDDTPGPKFVKQDNGLSYLVMDDVVYFIPKYDDDLQQPEGSDVWMICGSIYSGKKRKPEDNHVLSEYMTEKQALLDPKYASLPVKLIMSPENADELELYGKKPPEELFLVKDYAHFTQPLDMRIFAYAEPNAKQIYDTLINTPGLGGRFEIEDDAVRYYGAGGLSIDIYWDRLEIYVEKGTKLKKLCTWYPIIGGTYQMYEDVFSITKKGNMLVVHKQFDRVRVWYMGKKENYPYERDSGNFFEKLYYFEAE